MKDPSMDSFAILFFAGAAAIAPIMIFILFSRRRTGSAAIAALLCVLFAAFSALTIQQEGLMRVVENHAGDFWGIQVWYDLLIAASLALFFIVPRARAVGMNIPLWALFVAITASIGLLAMAARLFWLEQREGAPDAG